MKADPDFGIAPQGLPVASAGISPVPRTRGVQFQKARLQHRITLYGCSPHSCDLPGIRSRLFRGRYQHGVGCSELHTGNLGSESYILQTHALPRAGGKTQ